MTRAGSFFRSHLIDLGPLRRYRDFRLRTAASTVSAFGAFFTMIAGPVQVKELTGSTVAVGMLGVAEFVPIVVFGLIGGDIADRFDRRTVVIRSEIGALVCSSILLVNALLPSPRLWVVYVVTALAVTATSIQRPSLDAMLPRFVPIDDIPAANTINNTLWSIAGILGTTVGGVLATTSLPLAFGVDVVSFLVSLVVFVRVSPVPPTAVAGPINLRASIASIGEGVRYASRRKDLLGTYIVDTIAMMMAMPEAIFPFFASELGAEHAVGLLYAADGLGSIVASAFSGWITRVHRHGVAVMLGALFWGASIGLAGLMPNLPLAMLFLALAGVGDMVSGTFRGAIWAQTVPDEYRGRLAGIELLSYSVGPTVGNARAGLMAAGSVRFSIAGGGVLCVAGVLAAAAALPAFRRYDNRTDEHALAERARREGGTEAAS